MADTLTFKIGDRKAVVDSVMLKAGHGVLRESGFKSEIRLPVSELHPGNNLVTLELKLKNGRIIRRERDLFVVSDIVPDTFSLEVLRTLPHDTSAFVQGLVMHDLMLYESAGLKGRSRLRIIDPVSGECVKDVKTDPALFNEGIAFIGDTLFMLTWKDSLMLRYDEDLNEKSRHVFSSEGWGLYSRNDTLCFSNGTNKIVRYYPVTGSAPDTLFVINEKGPVYYINEMEWIEGNIYANIYGSDDVVVIDAETGKVIAVIQAGELIDRKEYPEAGVMNGIAYDKESKRIFLTGKNWPFIKVCSLHFDD